MRTRGFALAVVGLFAAGSVAIGTLGVTAGSAGITPKTGQACGTRLASTTTVCFGGATPITQAVNYALDGGTVNIGPGSFTEHLVLPYAVTMQGQGSNTIWAATVDAAADLSIVRAYSTTGFDKPLKIKNIRFRAKYAGSGFGYVITLKDGNPANVDTINNNTFDLYDDRCNAIAIWSYNSYATLNITNNTFTDMMRSVLLESSAGAGQVRRTPATVDSNLFYRQSKTTHGTGSVGVEINLAATTGAVPALVTVSNNQYNFAWENAGETSWGVIIDGDGGTDTTTGGFDSTVRVKNNNFKQVDLGDGNEATANNDASGNWWGCATGPNTPGCARATTPSPTITSFYTKALSLHAGVF